MSGSPKIRLVVGLGNPGQRYEMTRHNAGFLLIRRLAEFLGVSFKESKQFSALIAKGVVDGETIYLLLPLTYMNESGRSVRSVMDYYRLSLTEVLVVVDDVHVPFGEFRLKLKGSSGGHNGLKSIQQHVGSDAYVRLRVGVSQSKSPSLIGHVLGSFNASERERLPSVLSVGKQALMEIFRGRSLERVMNDVNRRPKKGSGDQDQSDRKKVEEKASSEEELGESS